MQAYLIASHRRTEERLFVVLAMRSKPGSNTCFPPQRSLVVNVMIKNFVVLLVLEHKSLARET